MYNALPKLTKIAATPQSSITDIKSVMKDHKIVSFREWEHLKNTKIHNENVLIAGFGDIHPFPNPPIFDNVKRVFLHHNYKYFHYYWINNKVFPSNPTIYMYGHPCDTPVLQRGFKMFIVGTDYYTAKRYSPNNPNIEQISEEEYGELIEDCEEEELLTSEYNASEVIDRLHPDDVIKEGGVMSAAIMKKAGW
jgi:hypothetical protein